MRVDYVPSIDWLKAIGITLIVFGHVAHGALAGLVPPIYPKQFGVAMFVYATAYGLARERRASWRAAANRLFEMFLFGLAITALLSGIGYAFDGDIRESNYLPFLAGVNVALDYFPANPTTWFIGMYVQLLLLWAVVLRHARVSPATVALVAVGEIGVRAILMERAGDYIAYMNVSNWLTVFLLGTMHGRQGRTPGHAPWWRAGLALAVLVVAWSTLAGRLVTVDSFPLMRVGAPGALGALAASVAVTFLYAAITLMTVATVSSLPAPASVRYVARNTVIVFIAHMPIYFALQPILREFTSSYWLAVAIQMLPCYFGLLWLSERVRHAIQPVALREKLLGDARATSPVPPARGNAETMQVS
jgi:fucose 4-O-acetylase-like acetyltransferase